MERQATREIRMKMFSRAVQAELVGEVITVETGQAVANGMVALVPVHQDYLPVVAVVAVLQVPDPLVAFLVVVVALMPHRVHPVRTGRTELPGVLE